LLLPLHFRIYVHTHKQAISLSSCLYDYSFLYQPPLFLLLYIHTLLYAAHHKGPCCASRTFTCERVFSTHFAAAAITIRHHIHSRRRRTYTHIQSKAKLLAHTYTTAIAYALHVWKKKRDEKAETYTHIYTYTRHVRAFSLAVDSSF
jgi:hypothetical protein